MIGPLTMLAAYLLGSIPFGFAIVRWKRGIDVRTTGSGSTGATNVMRNLGWLWFLAVFVLDFGKGWVSVWMATRLTGGNPAWVAAAAVGAVAGHCYPVWIKFRGGKGVATAVGVYMALAPIQVVIAGAIFLMVVALTRYISLGSMFAASAFPALLYFLQHSPVAIVYGAAVCAAVIISRHLANIARLLRGTESRVGTKKRTESHA